MSWTQRQCSAGLKTTRPHEAGQEPHTALRQEQLQQPAQLRASRVPLQGQPGAALHRDSAGTGKTGTALAPMCLGHADRARRPAHYQCTWCSSSTRWAMPAPWEGAAREVLGALQVQTQPQDSHQCCGSSGPPSTAPPDGVTGVATLRNLSMMVSIGFRYGAEEAASPAATHQIYPQSYCSLQLIAELETIRELPNYCQLERANQAPITHTHAAAALTIKCQISLETSNKIKSLTFNFSSTHSAGFQSA